MTLLVMVSLLLTQPGCYTWTAIQPNELQKLQPGVSETVGSSTVSTSTGTTTSSIVAHNVQTLVAEDGTAVQIRGDYDLRITTESNKTFTFDHPILVEPIKNGYGVRGGNQTLKNFDVFAIKKVEIGQLDRVKSALLASAVTAGVAFVLLAALIGSSASGTSP